MILFKSNLQQGIIFTLLFIFIDEFCPCIIYTS